MPRGRFITFEGGEGAGKTTQIRLLEEALLRSGRKVVAVREPGGSPLSEKIRCLLKDFRDDPPLPKTELLLFLAARAQLVESVIAPALEAGTWVLSDRFGDSTVAYQGYGRGLPLDILKTMDSFACSSLKPDATFLLELPAGEALRRMRSREEATGVSADRFETAQGGFHERVRAGFSEIARAEPGRVVRVDASGTVEEISAFILKSLAEKGFADFA